MWRPEINLQYLLCFETVSPFSFSFPPWTLGTAFRPSHMCSEHSASWAIPSASGLRLSEILCHMPETLRVDLSVVLGLPFLKETRVVSVCGMHRALDYGLIPIF